MKKIFKGWMHWGDEGIAGAFRTDCKLAPDGMRATLIIELKPKKKKFKDKK